MKNISFLTIAAVIATVSLSLGLVAVQYSGVLSSIVSCTFLLLTAAGEYGGRTRYHRSNLSVRHVALRRPPNLPLRLAA